MSGAMITLGADQDPSSAKHEAQAALFDGESDDSLFIVREELERRYTAEQARKIDSRRELIVLAVAGGWPVERIAAAARCSCRTVRALAAREAEKVACSTRDYAKILRACSMRWLALAKTRDTEANFKDLVSGASFLGSQATAIESGMGEMAGEERGKEVGLDVEAEAARLMELMGGEADPDVKSGGECGFAGVSGVVVEVDTLVDTGSTSQAAADGTTADMVAEGGGGGSDAGGAVKIMMPSPERAIMGKESL
jgi:hypothetical protein